MTAWHLITGEYPPVPGGVAGYTRTVARGLAAAGDTVDVWMPSRAISEAAEDTVPDAAKDRIALHRLPGHFGGRALLRLERSLRQRPGCWLLVQYAPHAYGYKAMNLLFCLWLKHYAHRHGRVLVMFHEVWFFRAGAQPWRYRLLTAVNRLMARLVARAAVQIFVADDAWRPLLRECAPATPIHVLPVTNNIPVSTDRDAVASLRRQYCPEDGLILGHFGTYPAAIAETLARLIVRLQQLSGLTILLLGVGSEAFANEFFHDRPDLRRCVVAPGFLPERETSLALAACDLMVQPYPDGVSTRHSSMMAALAHGRAIVTTAGSFTQPFWAESGAAALVPAGDVDGLCAAARRLLADPVERQRYAAAARALYDRCFALRHTTTLLQAGPCG